MQGSDETVLRSNDQDRHAIGTDNAKQDVGLSGDHSICLWALVPGSAGLIYHQDFIAVYLPHRT